MVWLRGFATPQVGDLTLRVTVLHANSVCSGGW
jgi:hypothetical protein